MSPEQSAFIDINSGQKTPEQSIKSPSNLFSGAIARQHTNSANPMGKVFQNTFGTLSKQSTVAGGFQTT